jgi:hypothetical protein
MDVVLQVDTCQMSQARRAIDFGRVGYIYANGDELRKTSPRLRCKQYSAVGPNFIWHIDGYDKPKPFGLCVSGCIDGFSRKIIWLDVYKTNSDPKVIGGYYITAVQKLKGWQILSIDNTH